MNEKELEELTAQLAAALGVSGAFRMVGDDRMYVLDRAGTMRWGEPLFDPVRNSEHSFLLAGVFGLAVAFGTSYALARPHAVAGPTSTELYNRHPDRFAAARVAVGRCIAATALLERQAGPALVAVPYRDRWA